MLDLYKKEMNAEEAEYHECFKELSELENLNNRSEDETTF